MLFDSHNHLQHFGEPAEIIREMRAAGIGGCTVNGTCEDDWEAVAKLAEEFPGFVRPAFGLHPWHARKRSGKWLQALEGYLDRFPAASVGECGLDGWVSGPSIEEQREVFLPQLAIARERDLPVTIHALKAWEPLFEAFDAEPPPPRFLMHSFGGSPELVKRLVPLGARFSFSGYFLQPRQAQVVETFRAVPKDRLLIETDAPDMLPPPESISHPLPGEKNHPANLGRIAVAFAGHLEMTPESLAAVIAANHAALFAGTSG